MAAAQLKRNPVARTPRRAILAIAGLLTVLALAPGSALATHVSCGDVITEDTTLDSDLFCGGLSESDSALIIGADNVTLDLGGHSLSGPATGIGIDNRGGYDDVRILNGTVRSFDEGVFLAGEADRNRLSGLMVRDIGFNGIAAFYSEDLLVANNTIHNTDGGIWAWDAEHSRIAHNVHSNDEDPDFRRNSAFDAISLSGDHNEVVGNVISTNAVGMFVNGSRNKLVGNTVRLSEFRGISVDGADHTLLRRNVVNDNIDRPGGQDGPVDGIFIGEHATATRLVHNRADRNGDDGIEIRSADTRLIASRANLNGDFGIEAVPGVRDAGNRASGNGNPLQCLNVKCR